MSLGRLIERAVAYNTDEGVVDVFGVAANLGCEIVTEFKHSTLIAAMRPCSSEDKLAEIALNKNNDHATNRTVVAIMLADYLINLVHCRSKKITVDTFFLSEIRNYKMSSSIMIGTRIAIPNEVINMFDCPTFDSLSYACEAELLPNFVSSTLKMSNSWLVNTIHGKATPQLLKLINISKKSDLKLASLI